MWVAEFNRYENTFGKLDKKDGREIHKLTQVKRREVHGTRKHKTC